MLCYNVKSAFGKEEAGSLLLFGFVLFFFLFEDEGENTPAKEVNLGCE